MPVNKIVTIGSLFLALGVGLGAFGAHGLKAILIENNRVHTFETAVLYHFVHGIGLLIVGVADIKKKKAIALFFTIGIFCFSGSLYTLAITNVNWLGAVAPVGGAAFILGWTLLGWQAYKT